jgi:hypothetical protein
VDTYPRKDRTDGCCCTHSQRMNMPSYIIILGARKYGHCNGTSIYSTIAILKAKKTGTLMLQKLQHRVVRMGGNLVRISSLTILLASTCFEPPQANDEMFMRCESLAGCFPK